MLIKPVIYGLPVWVSVLALIGAAAPAQIPPHDLDSPLLAGVIEPLPSLPELPPTPEPPIQLQDRRSAPTSPQDPDRPAASFWVDQIQVVGNTIFQSEIDALVAPLVGQNLTLAQLLDLRTAITQLYVDQGYVSSGAFLPTNQDLSDGVVQIQVVEGQVEQIQINGLSHLKDYYVRDRIAPATSPPLNLGQLEAALQLLQVNPLLARVDAELTAGSGPGQSILILDLSEADPFSANFGVDNYRSPSIGSWQGGVGATDLNLLGFGDRLSATYNWTEGLDLVDLTYAVPLNGRDGTLLVFYEYEDSRIIDPQFVAVGIRSESETLSVSFRQPLTRSLTNELALGVGLDLRASRSFILNDIPFSFSVGVEDGRANVTKLNFFQEWVNRDQNTVVAARSQFNLGLGMLGATVNDSGTDGRFFSWLGQFQWVEQVLPSALVVTRLNAQLTPDSLLALERFSVGGIDTVRGYLQDQLVTDNAVTGSTELRLTVADGLQLTPFIDVGGGWNNQTPNPDPAFLLGVGVGLRWQPNDSFSLRVDYGIPLISVTNSGNSLQAQGLYFSVNLQPF